MTDGRRTIAELGFYHEREPTRSGTGQVINLLGRIHWRRAVETECDIQELEADPTNEARAAFDEKYGAGAAASILRPRDA
jgi:hypothetical protein